MGPPLPLCSSSSSSSPSSFLPLALLSLLDASRVVKGRRRIYSGWSSLTSPGFNSDTGKTGSVRLFRSSVLGNLRSRIIVERRRVQHLPTRLGRRNSHSSLLSAAAGLPPTVSNLKAQAYNCHAFASASVSHRDLLLRDPHLPYVTTLPNYERGSGVVWVSESP